MKVTILNDYQAVVGGLDAIRELAGWPIELRILTEHFADETAVATAVGADCECLVLIRERCEITATLLDDLPALRLIVQTGRLGGCIDVAACRQRGIEVRDGTGNPVAPAELTWALVLAAARRILPYARQLEAGHWQRSCAAAQDEQLGYVLRGRTLGVWSLGKIGALVAAYGRAFGMQVLVHGREQSRTAAAAAGYEYVAERRAFLSRVDVLSLHLRLNAETRHCISANDLMAMRPDALLVNTSRAELIAPNALLAALAHGRPGQAALDVFEDEPEGVRAYLGHPAILCTPHLGFVERDTFEAYFRQAFGHIRQYLAAHGNA